MDNAKKAAIFGLSFIFLVIVGAISHHYYLILIGLISLVSAIYFAYETNKDLTNESNELFLKVLKKNHFSPDKKTVSSNWLNGIAINENEKRIALVSRRNVNKEFDIKLLNFKDIIEAKVITDHETLISTSFSSMVNRGALGGLLFGNAGAIIGSTTASKTVSKKIKELTLEIVVNDILNPRYTLTLYKGNKPLDESNSIINEIETWYRSLNVIIKRNKHESRSV